jgi:putative solute:sodium symporter small subunit
MIPSQRVAKTEFFRRIYSLEGLICLPLPGVEKTIIKGILMSNSSAQSYWKSNIRIVLSLLAVWFFISFGCGILFVDLLDNFRIGGFKLGFWIAQQGAILVFVALIYVYIHLMDKLDDKYNLESSKDYQPNLQTSTDGDTE